MEGRWVSSGSPVSNGSDVSESIVSTGMTRAVGRFIPPLEPAGMQPTKVMERIKQI
jgi:hypothetical protein